VQSSYPPGPGWPAALQGLLFLRKRAWLMPEMRRRYGDVFTLSIPTYADNLVVFNRPEHIKEIFAADPADFHAGEGNHVIRPVVGEHSLFLTDEDEHARARRLLIPAFTGACMAGYGEIVAHLARAEVDRWAGCREIGAHERACALTLEVIMRVVFGITDQRTRDELAPRLLRIVNMGPLVPLAWAMPVLNHFGPWKRFHEDQKQIDFSLRIEIARRRHAADLVDRNDVLSRLLRAGGEAGDSPLTDAELRDHLVTLLLAGHEPTAAALAWTLYELAEHPDIQERAYLAARDDDEQYLEATLKESMRLHTVVAAAIRKLTRDQVVAGWNLPAGTVVTTSILLAHQRSDSYPDTWTYRPERFLTDEVEPNTWLPFGGGVRRCVGAAFSLMESTIVLREILNRFKLSRPQGEPPERGRIRNITNVPSRGARLIIAPRT
jgi:cytochrome P450